MKTNLLIATALLLSAGSFGQQTETASKRSETAPAGTEKIRNDASVQTSTKARVTTPAVGSVEDQAEMTKKQAEKTGSSVEKKATAESKSAIDKGQGAIEGNTNAKVSLGANSAANASSGDNKLSQNASLNTGVNASSSDVKNRVSGFSQDGQTTVKAKTTESLKTTASLKKEADKSTAETAGKTKTDLKNVQSNVKTKADAGSSTTIKAADGIKHSAKPQPVSVKVHNKIKTNAALKIK